MKNFTMSTLIMFIASIALIVSTMIFEDASSLSDKEHYVLILAQGLTLGFFFMNLASSSVLSAKIKKLEQQIGELIQKQPDPDRGR